jgi:hypothetical protein
MIEIRFFNWTGYHTWPWRPFFWLVNFFTPKIVHVDFRILACDYMDAFNGHGNGKTKVSPSDMVLAQANQAHGVAVSLPETTPQKPCEVFALPIAACDAWTAIRPLIGMPYSLASYPGTIIHGLPDVPGTNCVEFAATVLETVHSVDSRILALQRVIKQKGAWRITPRELRDLLAGAGIERA